LKSQIVISSWDGMCRAIPYALAEEGDILIVRSGEHSNRPACPNIPPRARSSPASAGTPPNTMGGREIRDVSI
jgi:hypothetical protein